jgi:virulence-associated protein VapD
MHRYDVIVWILAAVGKPFDPMQGGVYLPKEYRVEVQNNDETVSKSEWLSTWKAARDIAALRCQEFGERLFEVRRVTHHNVKMRKG